MESTGIRVCSFTSSCDGSLSGRFATPADFPPHDYGPYSHEHVIRESLRFVHRPRTISCRPAKPLTKVTCASGWGGEPSNSPCCSSTVCFLVHTPLELPSSPPN
jgi:hypothetical protein